MWKHNIIIKMYLNIHITDANDKSCLTHGVLLGFNKKANGKMNLAGAIPDWEWKQKSPSLPCHNIPVSCAVCSCLLTCTWVFWFSVQLFCTAAGEQKGTVQFARAAEEIGVCLLLMAIVFNYIFAPISLSLAPFRGSIAQTWLLLGFLRYQFDLTFMDSTKYLLNT